MLKGQDNNSSNNNDDSDESTIEDTRVLKKRASSDAEIAKMLQEEENQRPKRARQQTVRLVFADTSARSYPVSNSEFVPPAMPFEEAITVSTKKAKKAKRIELTEGLTIEASDYIAIEKDGEKHPATVIECDNEKNTILVCYDSEKWETLAIAGLKYSHYSKQAAPETLTFINPETDDVYKIYKGKKGIVKLKSKASQNSDSPDLDVLARAASALAVVKSPTTNPTTTMPVVNTENTTVAFTPIDSAPAIEQHPQIATPSTTLTTAAPLLFTQPEKLSDYDAEIAKHEALIAAQLAKVAELKQLRENALKAEQEKAQNLADVSDHLKLYIAHKEALEQINIATINLIESKNALSKMSARFYQKNNMTAFSYAENNSDALHKELHSVIRDIKEFRKTGRQSLSQLKDILAVVDGEEQESNFSSSSSSSRDLTSQQRLNP